MATVGSIIKRAMRALTVIDPENDPTTQEYTDGIELINAMNASWSAAPVHLYAPSQVTHSVVATDTSYTVGSGATIDTTRPEEIYSAWLRDSSGNDWPELDIKSLKEYTKIIDKDASKMPEKLYIRKGYANWTIYFDCASDASYTLYLELLQKLPTFSAYTDTFNLPDAYQDATVYNLALRWAPEFGTAVNQQALQIIAKLARDTIKVVKNQNSHPVPQMHTNPFSKNEPSNIEVGE